MSRTRVRASKRRRRIGALLPSLVCAAAICLAVTTGPAADTGDDPLPGYRATDIAIDSFAQPRWPDGRLYVMRPRDAAGPLPVVAYLPGLGALYPETNAGILRHTLSRGYAIVYCPSEPYRTVKEQTFAVGSAVACLRTAFDSLPALLDSTRICFAGHSQGAGIVPAVAYRCIEKRRWAHERALLYVMAPWYLFGISDTALASFPPHAFLFVQTYADDAVNDHRIARHLHRTIGIPPHRTRFMLVTGAAETSAAVDHSVPSTEGPDEPDDDQAIERCAVYPVFAAALDDVLRAKRPGGVVFGDSTPALLPDSCRRVVHAVYEPRIPHPQCRYLNFWTHRLNPHMTYRSYVGMGKPWKYASRVTIRNYRTTEGKAGRCGAARPWPHEEYVDSMPATSDDGPYGEPGPHDIVHMSFAHCGWGTGTHHLYLPRDTAITPPLIILLHDMRSPRVGAYRACIAHLVSRGNAVLYLSYDLPFRRLAPDIRRYHVLLTAVHEALDFTHRVDRTRVGIVAFGYGAGAAPAVAHHVFGRCALGTNGAFVYAVHPTVPRFIPAPQPTDLPAHLLVVVEQPQRRRAEPQGRIRRAFDALGAHGGARITHCRTDHRTPCGADVHRRAAALTAAAFEGDTTAYPAATRPCAECDAVP